MTNNADEFEQDQFDQMDEPERGARGMKESLLEAWRNKPLFKLLVIMGVVGFAMAGALGAFSSAPPIEAARIGSASKLNEPPGPNASSFFIEQNNQENEQRVGNALKKGGSAMPTPVGTNIDLSALTDKNKKDPMLEFRAEADRLKQEMRAEQKLNAQQMQALQQQLAQRNVRQGGGEEDDSLARAMQRQMQELMQGWVPRRITMVAGATATADVAPASLVQGVGEKGGMATAAARTAARRKAMVPAGTVSYAQLLTEANSDVQGPILAQILSGPLAGARAIGQFQVSNDYLVLTFHLISYKGQEYGVNILALDPDTTLGGLATEVDHRYFTRVLLPAAASFMSSFGSTMASGSSNTSVDNGTIVVSQAQKGYKDAAYAGLGQAGQTVSQFFQNQANLTKPLVRVEVGAAMGLFFLAPVYSLEDQEAIAAERAAAQPSAQDLLAQGYQQGFGSNRSQSTYNPSAATGLGGTYPSGVNTAYPNVSYNTGVYGTGYNNSYTNMPSGVYTTGTTVPSTTGWGASINYGR